MGTVSGKVTVNKTLLESAQALLDRLKGCSVDLHTQALINALQDELDAKYEADKRRYLYSTYKTAKDPCVRELARNLYHDSAGTHRDWRTVTETREAARPKDNGP